MASRAKEARARESQYRIDRANAPWVYRTQDGTRERDVRWMDWIRSNAPQGVLTVPVTRAFGRIDGTLNLATGIVTQHKIHLNSFGMAL